MRGGIQRDESRCCNPLMVNQFFRPPISHFRPNISYFLLKKIPNLSSAKIRDVYLLDLISMLRNKVDTLGDESGQIAAFEHILIQQSQFIQVVSNFLLPLCFFAE